MPFPSFPVPQRKPSPYERLKEAIMAGDILPGQPLVETALAAWCEVSRTPVREALTRLEQDGLVARTERGLVVRERSREEILDIYETRIVLESTAARVAAARRSSLDVLTMKRLASRLDGVDTSDERQMARANREFHQAVWQASSNEPLSDLLRRLDLHLARYPSTTLSQPGRWTEGNAEHRAIIAAIEEQDGTRAHELVAEHFTKARDLRLRLWAQEEGSVSWS